MYLLAILLAYALERTIRVTRNLQWRRIIRRWQLAQTKNTQVDEWRQNEWGQIGWALIPALLIGFIVLLINSVLVTFLVSAAGLLVAIQMPRARTAYKALLQAEAEGDEAARNQQVQELQYAAEREEAAPAEQLLLWIHLRYYFAVLVYFLLFGITGALLYATIRDMRHQRSENWTKINQIVEWLPTRLMGLGFLFVGHFSNAASVWLNSIGNKPQNNFIALTKTAEAAETLTALTTVALIKRNFLLYLVFIAILTIGGWL